jgi:hypothetical protein
MSHNPPASSDRTAAGLDRSLLAGFVICTLLAAAFGYWRVGGQIGISEADFAFEPIAIDLQKLEAQREEKFKTVHLDRAPRRWKTLLETARDANRIQFATAASPMEASTLRGKLRFHANEVIPATGYDGFVAATQPLRQECLAGLEELLAALRSGELSMEQARKNPPANQFSRYRDNCGKMLPMLVEHGLVTPEGNWSSDDAPIIVDILSRFRWAHIIANQRSPWRQLTPYEAKIFSRWRIEQARGYSLAKRLEFVEEIGQIFPNYPTEYARGVLAFQAGDIESALDSFEILAADRPQAGFGAYVRYLNERLVGPRQNPTRSAANTPAPEN